MISKIMDFFRWIRNFLMLQDLVHNLELNIEIINAKSKILSDEVSKSKKDILDAIRRAEIETTRKINETNCELVLGTLQEQTDKMIWVIDINHNYIRMNYLMQQFLGKLDIDVGTSLIDIIKKNPDDNTLLSLCFEDDKLILAGEITNIDDTIGGKVDGNHLVIKVTKGPMYDANNTIVGIAGTAKDVTDQLLIINELSDVSDEHGKALIKRLKDELKIGGVKYE